MLKVSVRFFFSPSKRATTANKQDATETFRSNTVIIFFFFLSSMKPNCTDKHDAYQRPKEGEERGIGIFVRVCVCFCQRQRTNKPVKMYIQRIQQKETVRNETFL